MRYFLYYYQDFFVCLVDLDMYNNFMANKEYIIAYDATNGKTVRGPVDELQDYLTEAEVPVDVYGGGKSAEIIKQPS